MLYERLSLDLHVPSRPSTWTTATTAHSAILHAQDIVMELRSSLKVELWSGGPGLAAIYD